ncbi:MAG TPA: DUF2147 domain-containing protein [Bryobacteraceae bacterium]|nr:DUF2147 domain-containing protein [Bryobacteraceae bacterium]
MVRALALLGLATLGLHASDPTVTLTPGGRWRTVDDKTGKPRSIVRIWEENGQFFGRVEQSLNPERAGRRCDKCTDERKDQLIVGMVIIRGLKQDGEEFTGGDILDPDNGKVYRCKVKVKEHGSVLSVRGYLGASLFGRSQTWTREPEENSGAAVDQK